MTARLPLLCECERKNAFVEHRDMNNTYVLWVMHRDASHVAFVDQNWLDGIVYTDGRTFPELLQDKPPLECCKMVSRPLLSAFKYKPDYVVVVADGNKGAPLTSGLCMGAAMRLAQPFEDVESIKRVVEGPGGQANTLGKHLTALFGALADKGFFNA